VLMERITIKITSLGVMKNTSQKCFFFKNSFFTAGQFTGYLVISWINSTEVIRVARLYYFIDYFRLTSVMFFFSVRTSSDTNEQKKKTHKGWRRFDLTLFQLTWQVLLW
jgi:hypothetical protein